MSAVEVCCLGEAGNGLEQIAWGWLSGSPIVSTGPGLALVLSPQQIIAGLCHLHLTHSLHLLEGHARLQQKSLHQEPPGILGSSTDWSVHVKGVCRCPAVCIGV